MFLSVDEFPERGTGRPGAVAIAELTFSMSRWSSRLFRADWLASRFFTRSFLSSRVDSSRRDYSGRAAILSRERPGAFPVPSHPPFLSPVTYRSAFPLRAGLAAGRSRIFTGQCSQPFCPGDLTNHSDGPQCVTKSRPVGEWIHLSRLRPAWERGLPSEPTRDTPRTIFPWPLRHRSLPPGAGCLPLSGSREDFQTGLDPPG